MGNWCSDEVSNVPNIRLDDDAVRLLRHFDDMFECSLTEFTKRATKFTAKTKSSGQIHYRSYSLASGQTSRLYTNKVGTYSAFMVIPGTYMTIDSIDRMIDDMTKLNGRTNGQLTALGPAIVALRAQLAVIHECIEIAKDVDRRAALRTAM